MAADPAAGRSSAASKRGFVCGTERAARACVYVHGTWTRRRRSAAMEAVIGTAGWSIASRHAEHFTGEGTALQRYAERFNGVEINSSFYRRHRPETWQRWAASVPAQFRFAVKLPRTITHE